LPFFCWLLLQSIPICRKRSILVSRLVDRPWLATRYTNTIWQEGVWVICVLIEYPQIRSFTHFTSCGPEHLTPKWLTAPYILHLLNKNDNDGISTMFWQCSGNVLLQGPHLKSC
jgi:hypothetical protein